MLDQLSLNKMYLKMLGSYSNKRVKNVLVFRV